MEEEGHFYEMDPAHGASLMDVRTDPIRRGPRMKPGFIPPGQKPVFIVQAVTRPIASEGNK